MFKYSEIREENEKKAREYGKKIVDLLADKNYEGAFAVIDDFDNGWTKEDYSKLAEMIEVYKEYNNMEISLYDNAEIPDITYKNSSKYERERFILDEENNTLFYDIDLLPSDLTLMLKFIYNNEMYEVVFYDVHQM